MTNLEYINLIVVNNRKIYKGNALIYNSVIKMSSRKTATAILLAGLLTFMGPACKTQNTKQEPQPEPQPTQQYQTENQQYQEEKIVGEILYVDEEEIPLWFVSPFPRYMGQFPIEFFEIKDKDGKVITLVYPGPTPYKEGDKIMADYLENDGNFTFDDISRYANLFFSGPTKKIPADGILIKIEYYNNDTNE